MIFSPIAWDQYLAHTDRKVIKKINELIEDVRRNGYSGIGKPEPLKEDLAGFWSRHITKEHRLVYRIVADDIEIASCMFHYGRRRN